ncbi:MAG: hypothetical protein ACYC19_00315 [Acidimicrobiales bacterium]
MNITPPNQVPPGWYPDPSGERQWRVWTGATWSEVTRPYGDQDQHAPVATMIPLITSLHWLLRYGVAAIFAGIGVVTSTLAHWPGTHAPMPLWLAETSIDTGFALLVAGTALFALALRELDGAWSIGAFVPGYNVVVTMQRVIQRVAPRVATRRVVAQLILVALYVAQSHRQPWLGVALVIAAADQMQWVQALIDQLVGPARSRGSLAS